MKTTTRSSRRAAPQSLRPRLLRALRTCDRWCHPGLSRSIAGLIALAEDPHADHLEPWERTYRVRLVLVDACDPPRPGGPTLNRDEVFESLVDRAVAKVEQVRRILARRSEAAVAHARVADADADADQPGDPRRLVTPPNISDGFG